MENPVNGKEGMENPGSPDIVLSFGVQGSRFSACKVESVYPGLVGAVKREVVKEKASLTSVGTQTD